jgi:sulfatase modifying factor 1
MRAPPRWLVVATCGTLLGAAGAFALYCAFPPNTKSGGTTDQTGAAAGSTSPGAADSGIGDAGTAGDAGVDAADDAAPDEPEPGTLAEQRERLFALLLAEGTAAEDVAKVRAIFEASPDLSQGNPAITVHPMTRVECRRRRAEAEIALDEPALCGKKYMVPAFDPAAGETRDTAKVCVDQYEFPGVPCEYPVVHVRASEAAALCEAVGKRLCDAHEWEGACAGAVRPPEAEYSFKHDRQYSSGMHNIKREILWAYGPKKNHGLCGTTSFKSKDCPGGGWKVCGSNTFPAGAFPECKSPFGVYDQHGNAAEHMNLPTRPEEMMSRPPGGGLTEMKGSWFIFSKGEPHLDDCRWREPSWHESKLRDPNSHKNYHLGFRCCRSR